MDKWKLDMFILSSCCAHVIELMGDFNDDLKRPYNGLQNAYHHHLQQLVLKLEQSNFKILPISNPILTLSWILKLHVFYLAYFNLFFLLNSKYELHFVELNKNQGKF